MSYGNTNIGNILDRQLEKNIENIRQDAISGRVTIDERLRRQEKEILTLENSHASVSNLARLDYIKKGV